MGKWHHSCRETGSEREAQGLAESAELGITGVMEVPATPVGIDRERPHIAKIVKHPDRGGYG